MKIFNTKEELSSYITELRSSNKKIALVPTMGALHVGHLSLIKEAKNIADVTICSIFVNPSQFNDPKDLDNYPKPIEQDIALLKNQKCDILFLPSVEEMYPTKDEKWHIDLGRLDCIWEGEKRPGHFQGVTQIVNKLFELVKPNLALFGQKDFQQVMVIQKMVEIKELPIEIIMHPIIRSAEGLALSSRNTRLSEDGLVKALIIQQALNNTKDNFNKKNVLELEREAITLIESEKAATLEYFAICETRTLEIAKTVDQNKKYIALAVVWIEGVRLIDNMLLN